MAEERGGSGHQIFWTSRPSAGPRRSIACVSDPYEAPPRPKPVFILLRSRGLAVSLRPRRRRRAGTPGGGGVASPSSSSPLPLRRPGSRQGGREPEDGSGGAPRSLGPRQWTRGPRRRPLGLARPGREAADAGLSRGRPTSPSAEDARRLTGRARASPAGGSRASSSSSSSPAGTPTTGSRAATRPSFGSRYGWCTPPCPRRSRTCRWCGSSWPCSCKSSPRYSTRGRQGQGRPVGTDRRARRKQNGMRGPG